MVNRLAYVQLPRDPRRGVAILDAELAARAVAVGVDGGLRHAQLTGDLLRRKMLIDKAQAFALADCEQPHGIFDDVDTCAHAASSKRRLGLAVYFKAKIVRP